MKEIIGLQAVRSGALRALNESDDDSAARMLRNAAQEMFSRMAEGDTRPTASVWRAYGQALKAVAALRDWVSAVRRAEPDRGRHLDSAHLLAAEAVADIDASEPLTSAVANVLARIRSVASPADVGDCIAALTSVPIPVPIQTPPRQRFIAHDQRESLATAPVIAVAVFELDGELAPDTALVQAHRFYDLRLEVRVTDWPDWADQLTARALSIAGDSAQFPEFKLARPQGPDDDGLWTVAESSLLVIKAVRPLGANPISFVLDVELLSTSDGRRETIVTVGQRELRFWAVDDSAGSFLTGYPQLDERVAKIFAHIWNNDAFGSDRDRQSFMSFLVGLLRVATVMQKRNQYPPGTRVNERRFQADLLQGLELRDELAGRVRQGDEIGGGETDLVYEHVVAELKVEGQTPVTDKNVSKYLGQTTSYASGLGSQLGIAVVLDLSQKRHPLGIPANYVHWLEPKLHGVEAASYPSHIAVIVVNGNVPLPSSFAGRAVDLDDSLSPERSPS